MNLSGLPYQIRLHNWILIACLGLLALSCTSSKSSNQQDSSPLAFEITKTNGEVRKSADTGDYFQLALHECVGCRYVWKIIKQDTHKISLEGRTFRDKSCEDCAGGSLTRIFRFKCLEAGQSELVLGYFDDTLRVVVDVK